MDKWDGKFMLLAEAVAEDNHACYSRRVGAVLVNPSTQGVLSIGYNGPAKGVPHCDTKIMREWLFSRLSEQEKTRIYDTGAFLHGDDKTCPRRLLKCASGTCLQFCQAVHAERNAILNAARNGVRSEGATLYCWCGRPCSECAREIINAGIKRVVCLWSRPAYDELSKFIFDHSDCVLHEIDSI